MPSDWLAIGAVLAFVALLFLTGATMYSGRIAAWSRLGCAAIGFPAAAVISMVLFALSAMSGPHGTDGSPIGQLLIAAVPFGIAIGLMVISTRGTDRRAAVRQSCFAGLVGCAVLALLFAILVAASINGIRIGLSS